MNARAAHLTKPSYVSPASPSVPASPARVFALAARPFCAPAAEKGAPQQDGAAAEAGVSRQGSQDASWHNAAPLVDMHLHLDWYDDPGAFARGLSAHDAGCLGCTVEPCGYETLTSLVAGVERVHPALGLHPWYMGEELLLLRKLDAFCQLAQKTRFIGEVGLDFGKAHQESAERQRAAFARVCEAVQPGSVMSIHSVRSASAVLDVLEASGRLADCICIFHWFSGTSKELARAREAGCFFSVGPFMLKSRRGREYARQIPAAQLLLETDLPECPGTPGDAAAHAALLEETRRAIAELKGL